MKKPFDVVGRLFHFCIFHFLLVWLLVCNFIHTFAGINGNLVARNARLIVDKLSFMNK